MRYLLLFVTIFPSTVTWADNQIVSAYLYFQAKQDCNDKNETDYIGAREMLKRMIESLENSEKIEKAGGAIGCVSAKSGGFWWGRKYTGHFDDLIGTVKEVGSSVYSSRNISIPFVAEIAEKVRVSFYVVIQDEEETYYESPHFFSKDLKTDSSFPGSPLCEILSNYMNVSDGCRDPKPVDVEGFVSALAAPEVGKIVLEKISEKPANASVWLYAANEYPELAGTPFYRLGTRFRWQNK